MRIENIPIKILGAVRQRIGADDENDTLFDDEIQKMTPKEVMAKWSAWKLGDEYWADFVIRHYEEMKEKETM